MRHMADHGDPGGGGSGGSSGGGGGSGGGPTPLNVQETAGVPSAFVAFGISKGFFDKHGLDVKLQTSRAARRPSRHS